MKKHDFTLDGGVYEIFRVNDRGRALAICSNVTDAETICAALAASSLENLFQIPAHD